MHTTDSQERLKLRLPFVGRDQEAAQLQRLHMQRKHVLILGPQGVGKTALVARLRQRYPLIYCPRSTTQREIYTSLERELDLEPKPLRLVPRKNRLLEALARTRQPVVFDGVDWTTPKLSAFLESVMKCAPIWICSRSEHSWDIGHFWRLLVRFEKVELHPFRLAETRALVRATAETGLITSDALDVVEWLHHRSNGNPLVLRRLLEELVAGHYSLTNPHALRRLDLDRRIHELFPPAPSAL